MIKAVLVNPTGEPYTCHIRVNGIVKEEAVIVKPGEKREVTVTLCLTGDGSCRRWSGFRLLPEAAHKSLQGNRCCALQDTPYIDPFPERTGKASAPIFE